MSATMRAVEKSLDGISAHGDGTWDWQFEVIYLDPGGTLGASVQESVFVNHTSKTALPSTTARANAYVSHGNSLSGAGNTMQALLPVSLITFVDL